MAKKQNASVNNETHVSFLKEHYEKVIIPEMKKEFAYKSDLEVPKLLKIVVSMGVKEASVDSKIIERAFEDLWLIACQKPVITKAKKSIAAFKLREGAPIGCKVTLRKNMMYDFLFRFVNIALPRVKDFRGLSPKKFDGTGNFAFGIKEHIVFPEINYDKIDRVRGMNIVFVTTAKTNEEALALFKKFNFPFAN